jgi:hypothetical protein
LFQTYWTVLLEFLLKQEKPCTKLSSYLPYLWKNDIIFIPIYGFNIFWWINW